MPLSSPRFNTNERLVLASENNPALRRGERGEGIRVVQQSLIELGFKMPTSVRKYGSPDGHFGNETKSKVQEFQRKHTLSADGVVGKQTMSKLNSLLPSSGKVLPPLPAGIPTRLRYSVPMVAQGPNPICWVACAAMILSYKRQRSVTVGEINNGFDPSNSSIANPATSWPVFYTLLDDLGFKSTGPYISPSEDFLLNLLRFEGPFILTHYTKTLAPAVTGVGTHAVVVTGIDMTKDVCFFNNPWGIRNAETPITTILGSMELLWSQNIRSVAHLKSRI